VSATVALKNCKAARPEFETARRFSFWEYLDPMRLTADVFNRASVQKLQIFLFSFLVAGMLLALTLMSGHLSAHTYSVACGEGRLTN
jgi:hypothetical protein